jgi:hypothetical protein
LVKFSCDIHTQIDSADDETPGVIEGRGFQKRGMSEQLQQERSANYNQVWPVGPRRTAAY